MSDTLVALQVLSISTALTAAGGIAALSVFDVSLLQAQPASRSLPSIRWLFSRGSHIFPSAAFLSSAGFACLAYFALPRPMGTVAQLLKSPNGPIVGGYIAAAMLAISIAPVTTNIMLSNNFALIELNERKGGARSVQSAETKRDLDVAAEQRTAETSVNGQGEANQWTDLSLPQTETPDGGSSADEDAELRRRLDLFARQNLYRAGLMGVAGVTGLFTALRDLK